VSAAVEKDVEDVLFGVGIGEGGNFEVALRDEEGL
jgi:hypothetical protein